MKLEVILDKLNSFEKNSFLKIIESLLADKPKNAQAVDKIFTDSTRDLKNMDNINVAKAFSLVEIEFVEFIKSEFVNTSSQLDILTDIIIRDGNCIIKQDWFVRLYEKELSNLNRKLKEFQTIIDDDQSDVSEHRRRDYKIYRSCLSKAYRNDEENNQEYKITTDELSILLTLSNELGLSKEEVKLINYLILPVKKLEIDIIINELKSIGVIFFSKKTGTIYIADEIVRILRKVRGKEVADKYLRRILRLLREPQINLICKNHGIDWRLPLDQKNKEIIKKGISVSSLLMDDIHKEGTKVTEKKKFINDFAIMGLKLLHP